MRSPLRSRDGALDAASVCPVDECRAMLRDLALQLPPPVIRNRGQLIPWTPDSYFGCNALMLWQNQGVRQDVGAPHRVCARAHLCEAPCHSKRATRIGFGARHVRAARSERRR